MELTVGWIKRFLKKLWNVIRVILVVILIIFAIYCTIVTGGAAIPWLAGMTGYAAALCAVGLAFVIDPETAGQAMQYVADGLGKAANAIGRSVSQVGGSALSGLFGGGGFLGLAAAAGLAWFVFTRKRDGGEGGSESETVEAQAKVVTDPDETFTPVEDGYGFA